MTPRFRQARFALVAFAALATGNAFAAFTPYFGSQDAGGVMPGFGAAITANGMFLKQLVASSVKTEDFEGFITSDPTNLPAAPLSLFGNPQISLNGAGVVTDLYRDPITLSPTGRFNTTSGGSNWWETNGSFTITFTNAITAFGMYGTDWGDFGGTFSLTLKDAGGNPTTLGLCGDPANDVVDACGSGTTSGTLSFFGFTDPTGYKSITFNISSTDSKDYFGFDDLVIGDLASPTNNVPEPATLSLAGLALAGLAASRRKRRG